MKNANTIKLFSRPLFNAHLSTCPTSKLLICKSIYFEASSAALKVDPEMLVKFLNDICMEMYRNGKINSIPQNVAIDLHQHYFCAETIRDIYSGIISDLQADSSKWDTNSVVSFGYLAGNSKPQRIKYVEMCESFPQLNYISTEKFNRYCRNSSNFTSVIKLKKRHKYFIVNLIHLK